MEREQSLKFMHDLLRALIARKGSDLFITAGASSAAVSSAASCAIAAIGSANRARLRASVNLFKLIFFS